MKKGETMYMVYWTQNVTGSMEAQSEVFESDEMLKAMSFMEGLRQRQHKGEGLHFIGMVSENPNCVGKMGASDVESGYNWTKRRSTALRKDQVNPDTESQ
jgi:hypothetical protein